MYLESINQRLERYLENMMSVLKKKLSVLKDTLDFHCSSRRFSKTPGVLENRLEHNLVYAMSRVCVIRYFGHA